MQQYGKRICALLLVLCMLVGVLPAGALAEEVSTQIKGRQLVLGDDLTMHFYASVSDAHQDAVMQISVDGEYAIEHTVSEMTAEEDGTYDFYVDLSAAQITDTIDLVLTSGDAVVLEDSYTVLDYLHALLEGNYTSNTKAMVKELLNYGAKAQLYFDHKTDSLANAGYEIETTAVIPATGASVSISGKVDGLRFYGASMVFESRIAMKFYFEAANGSDGYTVSVDDVEHAFVDENGYSHIEAAGINPQDMDKDIVVSVSDGTDTMTVTYSPMDYMIRMYNKSTTSAELKALLVAANSYFVAANEFTGVAQPRTGSMSMQYRYGNSNLIQINTDLPSDTPCVNFTVADNGCNIDQSGNSVQQVGWIGMDNANGTIVLTFHFNNDFTEGQSYVLPKGAVFGFTDESKYTLDKNYTFTFDGSSWTMEAKEPAVNLSYRYGTNNLIQFNTDLPANTPCVNFTVSDNGCSIDETANQYQNAGWIGMDNVDGTIVLTFHFNANFEVGQSYTLGAGSLFGFTDGSKYELTEDVTLYWTGSEWSVDAPVIEEKTVNFDVRYGTNNLIQVNTDLPSNTPCVNFTVSDNGCSIDETANQYQNVGWIGMDNVDGIIVLTFHFNGAFEAGQTYVLPKGAVFGFTDGNQYILDGNYTFTFDGSSWSKDVKEDRITLAYRYGSANLIQYNTNLPADITLADFTADNNGCAFIQSGDQIVGWISMANADGTIVLTFNFNEAFAAGQSYTLSAGSIFGFADGSKYELYEDVTLYWDGTAWTAEKPVQYMELSYRYGAGNLIQFNTNLPATTALKDFLASDNGCQLIQGGDQQVGYISMLNADDTIVLTFNFNAAFTYGQSYTLAAGSVFGFTEGTSYVLSNDVTLYWDGTAWTAQEPAKSISLSYRYGAGNLIQFNTDLPATTALKDFLASDNGCQLVQGGDQQVGYISMLNADGTIVLTFNFNAAFAYGQSYTLAAGSVFGFTDGTSYVLSNDVTLYWDGSAWTAQEPAKSISLSYRYGEGKLIQFDTDLPATTALKDFLASDNGCQLAQGGDQQVGYISMLNADGTIVLTFNFNAAFTYGQSYTLAAGSVFGFTDGTSYVLSNDVTLYWDGAVWTAQEPAKTISLSYRYGEGKLIQFNTDLPATTALKDFLASDNGCQLAQSGDQQVGYISMANADGTIVLTFNFNAAFTYGQSYTLAAGSVFGFTDGSSYNLDRTYTFYWDGSAWSETEPAPQVDVLDESNFTGGDVITFADLPVDSKDPAKIEEYKGLGFNTSLLTEDHTGAQGPDERYTVSMETANAPANGLSFAYRYGTSTLIQVNTNLPASTPIANFTADQNGCSIDQSGNTVQWVGWIGMANADGTIVLTFNFNNAFAAGQSYVLPKGAVFGFTDGNTYTLDADYTFTFDGANWSMNASTLSLSLSAGAAEYIQLKTNIPTGLTYGDFLLGDTSKGNLILETTEGAQSVAWFSYSELSGAVYLTFNFSGYNKPGTQYILKAGTSLKAGDNVYTTDRDYVLTVQNDYLTSLENLNNAGLNVWIRNYHNTTDYFTDNLTATLLMYKDIIDGFYMVDEMFQTNELLVAAGQESNSSDFESMVAVRDWFNTNFADKYYHSNHVPLSSWDHYTSTTGSALSAIDVDGYRNFLSTYKQKFNDQLINASGASVSFDNYPFVHDQGKYGGFFGIGGTFESGIQDTYLLNCLIAAQVAAEDDFGLCVQTFKATDLKNDTTRDITSAAEVSLQLYTGMAMGADLFEYFAYNSNGEFETIMNQDGSKRIYDIVKEGNQALCFADVVNSFTWNGIVTSAGSVNNHNGDAFDSVANMVLTNISNGALDSYSSTDDAVIGCFTKDDLNGYMVVNYNDPAAVTGNNTVTLTFADCTRARVYTEVDGVLTSEVVELTNGTYTATLVPGSGCFVIPA